MISHDLARDIFGRPIVLLVCGRGDYAARFQGELLTLVHVHSRAQLTAALYTTIDVAIVEESPWPGEDGAVLGRIVRARGIGTVFVARGLAGTARLLRDRVTVDLSLTDVEQRLDNAIWLACCETELLRRDASEALKRISDSTPPAVMRYVGADGQMAPSRSTMAYMFGEAPRLSMAEGALPLAAPEPLVAPEAPEALPGAPRRPAPTQMLPPSTTLLQSLRRQHEEDVRGDASAWAVIIVASLALVWLAVMILLR